MNNFSRNTQKLLLLLGCPWPDLEEGDDSDAISAALKGWENEIDDGDSDWPAEPPLLQALRLAVEEHTGQEISQHLAYALVRCGCRNPQTLSALHPWDALLFRWNEAGLSAQDLWQKFQQAGAAGQPGAADFLRLDEWLARPGTALVNFGVGVSHLSATILKGRVFVGSLYHNGGQPDYAGLVEEMARHSQPALPITNIQVRSGSDWEIHFQLEGKAEVCRVAGDDTWLNDDGLAREFERVAARPQRILRFAQGRSNDGSFWGRYIVADPQPFRAVCAELGIPLLTSGGWAQAQA